MAAMIVLMALLGLAIGSFVSVVAHRVPLGESIVTPRSRCPGCGAPVANRDNIPVLSYLLLRGRCRNCGVRISPLYPLLELALAASFVAALLAFEEEPVEIVLACVFAATLAAITVTDLEHRRIPTTIIYASAAIGIALVAVGDLDSAAERAIAAASAYAFLFAAAVLYPGGMGMGDVRLAGLMGLYLGRAVAPALLFALLLGALYGTYLIARGGSQARKSKVPFGPFLAAGSLLALFVGNDIADWYVDTFFSG